MNLRLFAFAVVALCWGVIFIPACTAGPSPQPVTDEALATGEETAREAGEAAGKKVDEEGVTIYASSRSADDPAKKEEKPEQEDTTDPAISTVFTVYLDAEGRLLDGDGRAVDVDDLTSVTELPLAGRALRLVIDPEAQQTPLETIMPFFDAVHAHHAFVDVTAGEAPTAVETGDNDDENENDGSTPE